jgi:hypothetical protein
MKTVAECLRDSGNTLRVLIEELVLRHSAVYLFNPPDSLVISGSGNHSWDELSPEGRRLQARTLEEYQRFAAVLRALFRHQPSDTREQYEDAVTTVLAVVEQTGSLWEDNREEPLARALAALRLQTDLLERLHSSTDEPIFVPDTNALLYNPDLEKWKFDDVAFFTLMMTPTVVSELDRLKSEHRNEAIRERAEGLVRRMKEYRRRGALTEGVVLAKSRSRLQAIAIEPDVQSALPWLDAANGDDRLIASMIEVMRRYPRAAVCLVTRDLNLQNKAEFARLPFVEPTDPAR